MVSLIASDHRSAAVVADPPVPDMMERQASLGLRLPKSVAVVGVGGVGSWTALFLALAGVPEIWLFDKDTVSGHNLNRIPLTAASIGKHKSFEIADEINRLRSDCHVIPAGEFDPELAAELGLAKKVQWIVATTDTLSSRRMVHQWANKQGVNYIEAAAEGEMGSATGEPAMFSTPEEDSPGYASVPVWVSPCVTSAIAAVSYIVHNTPMDDRTIRMGWDGQNFLTYDSARSRSASA